MIKYCAQCNEKTEHYLDISPTKPVLVPYCCKCRDRRKIDLGRPVGERRRKDSAV